jgi:glycosyltransferase involved in cell wall biosynthesis
VEAKHPVLLMLVTEDWYFCLHRLEIARAARAAGYRVLIATQVSNCRERIEQEGLELLPMTWSRASLNPLHAFSEIWQTIRIFRKYRPDLVHLVALKPSLYGGIAALLTGTRPIVYNLAGLGGAFSAQGVAAGLVRRVLIAAFRVLFRRQHTNTIVENSDDREFLLTRIGLAQHQAILIRGIGVDEHRFSYSEEPAGEGPVITLVSRLLWPKGIGELVAAGRLLSARDLDVRIQLVGEPDPASRLSVPESQLRAWQSQGVVTWLGHRDDIPEIWGQSNIAVLPSYYREGIPRSLLEAAACGRAIVTTDMPGCREIVEDGKNGLLIPPQDITALADALEKLIREPALRAAMGREGRAKVLRDYTQKYVVEQSLAVYERLLQSSRRLR